MQCSGGELRGASTKAGREVSILPARMIAQCPGRAMYNIITLYQLRIATSKTKITLSTKTTTNSRLSVDYIDFNFATIRLCQILRLCRFIVRWGSWCPVWVFCIVRVLGVLPFVYFSYYLLFLTSPVFLPSPVLYSVVVFNQCGRF